MFKEIIVKDKDLKVMYALKKKIITLVKNRKISNNDNNYVNRVLNNIIDITVFDLHKISNIFHISLSELCDVDRGL